MLSSYITENDIVHYGYYDIGKEIRLFISMLSSIHYATNAPDKMLSNKNQNYLWSNVVFVNMFKV
jgi:hypothetical protein